MDQLVDRSGWQMHKQEQLKEHGETKTGKQERAKQDKVTNDRRWKAEINTKWSEERSTADDTFQVSECHWKQEVKTEAWVAS